MAVMTPRNCADLLAECRAAGLGVYPGPGDDDLCIIGDADIFTRYQNAIKANKAALLEHFEREAAARCAQDEAADIAHGKRFCRRDCPHLKPWRHDWPPKSRTFWCRHAGARLNRLEDCPDRQTNQSTS